MGLLKSCFWSQSAELKLRKNLAGYAFLSRNGTSYYFRYARM